MEGSRLPFTKIGGVPQLWLTFHLDVHLEYCMAIY